eukprot:48424-Prorocentrum_minimum.AAC.1
MFYTRLKGQLNRPKSSKIPSSPPAPHHHPGVMTTHIFIRVPGALEPRCYQRVVTRARHGHLTSVKNQWENRTLSRVIRRLDQ